MADDEDERSKVWRELFAEYDRASIESLQKQPESSSEDARGFKMVNDLKREKVRKAKQQNELRERFFRWTSILASAIIAGNFVLMAYYAHALGGKVPDNVMIYWISSTVVQILGIVYIIARYLFPRPKTENRRK